MAPPDRQPDPGHPAAAGLDGEFGHEGEIAAWVEWMLHPETHSFDRVYVMGGERHEVTYRDHAWEEDYGNPPESVIQGCFVEQFFEADGRLRRPSGEVAEPVHRKCRESSWVAWMTSCVTLPRSQKSWPRS